jgi:2-polyprenyl-3-methyl-5-hydroxy-6-metoxy-1,4-benzoquinol methylase
MFKENYFSDLQILSKAINNRQELGERELATLEKLAKFVGYTLPKDNGLIIDLGCGDKHLQAAAERRGLSYKGLDIVDLNLEKDKLPLADQTVDVAVSLAVIEHITNPEIYLSEIHRVLKPGGLVYLSTPNWQMDSKNFFNDPTHVKPYTPAALERTLRMFGFQNPKTFPGLRCKSDWFYKGKYRFIKAYYLVPFSGTKKFAPSFLKGHSRSIFGLAIK